MGIYIIVNNGSPNRVLVIICICIQLVLTAFLIGIHSLSGSGSCSYCGSGTKLIIAIILVEAIGLVVVSFVFVEEVFHAQRILEIVQVVFLLILLL